MDFLAATDLGKFPSQINDCMEEVQRPAQVRGGGDGGYSGSFCFIPFPSLCLG